MTELTTMSVHALSERVEELQQQLQAEHEVAWSYKAELERVARNFVALNENLYKQRECWEKDVARLQKLESEPTRMFEPLTLDVLAKALQFAWDDHAADTGCFPDCFEWRGGNGTLYADFTSGGFTRRVFEILRGHALASPAAEPDIHCDTLSELRKLGGVLGIAMPESLEMMRPSLVKQIIRRTTQLFEQQPAPATEPVKPDWGGEGLPPVGCDVIFNTASSGDVIGTVTGYHVWPDLKGDKFLHRVFVDLVYKGTELANSRMLCDVRPVQPAPVAQSEQCDCSLFERATGHTSRCQGGGQSDDHIHIGCEAGLCDVCNEQSQEGGQ